jgi:hypothetical protein
MLMGSSTLVEKVTCRKTFKVRSLVTKVIGFIQSNCIMIFGDCKSTWLVIGVQ